MHDVIPILAGSVIAIIGIIGSYLDIRYRRLPNWLCVAALLTGLAFGLLLGGWKLMGLSLLHAIVALMAGMVLFAWGGIGGGDAKYYAALAGWIPLNGGISMLVMVSISGILVLIGHHFANKIFTHQRDEKYKSIPYGVAISLGSVSAYVSMIMR